MKKKAAKQKANSKVALHLAPWQYKPGQSGNPSGRPLGSVSLKTYMKNKFLAMNDEEREEFLTGINKLDAWRMGEGSPDQDLMSGGQPIKSVVIIKEHGGEDTPTEEAN